MVRGYKAWKSIREHVNSINQNQKNNQRIKEYEGKQPGPELHGLERDITV